MKVLPSELLDYIYTFTDLETVLLQQPNNKYLLDYFGYPYLQHHIKLHQETLWGKATCPLLLIYKEIDLPQYIYNHKKLETEKRQFSGYLTLTLKFKPFLFFNLLELKFYNPEKKKFNEIFDWISFIIGYEMINEINNEEYINIINEIEKTGRITHNNNYTIIPLPFLVKKNYLVTKMYDEIKIEFKLHGLNEIQEPEIYASTYDIYRHTLNTLFIDFTEFNNRIIQQKCISLNNLDQLQFFNCIWSFIGDFTNIKSIVLSLAYKEIIYNIKSLKHLSKIKGYNFDYPTIIFNDIFIEQKSFINFNKIYKKTIYFIDKNNNKIIPNENYKLIAININLLITMNNMIGIRYTT